MRLMEFFEPELTESRMVWRKSGNKVVRAVRCTSGPRKGRVVATTSQCSKPINLKKRFNLRKTKAKFGKRLSRKANKTKRLSPTSKRVASMNKSTRRKPR